MTRGGLRAVILCLIAAGLLYGGLAYAAAAHTAAQAAAVTQAATQTVVKCKAGVKCVGTTGADLIVGTEGRDTIDGRGGKDEIYGNAGKDDIRGGGGADHIYPGGGSGGADAYNIVRGEDGDDYIDATVDTSSCPLLWVTGGNGEDSAWSYGFKYLAPDVEHWGTFPCP